MVMSPWLYLSVLCMAGISMMAGPVTGKTKVQRVPKRPCLKQDDSSIYNFLSPDIWNERNISMSEASGKV